MASLSESRYRVASISSESRYAPWEFQTKLLHYFFTSNNKSNLHMGLVARAGSTRGAKVSKTKVSCASCLHILFVCHILSQQQVAASAWGATSVSCASCLYMLSLCHNLSCRVSCLIWHTRHDLGASSRGAVVPQLRSAAARHCHENACERDLVTNPLCR